MQIISMREAGMTRQEIADELGLEKEPISISGINSHAGVLHRRQPC